MNHNGTLPEFIGEALDVEQGSPPNDAPELEGVLVALAASAGVDAPPAALKARLLVVATTGPTRYAPLFDDLGRLFDLGVDAVVRLLERAGLESAWEAGPHPSIRLFHLEPGPSLATADAGLVRMPAGFEWPGHSHSAAEKVLILEGGYTESTGRVYRAGDIHEMAAGTAHSFVVLPDSPLVFAVILHGPIEML
jgi:quercetin dioxygenase-like cupin family protein